MPPKDKGPSKKTEKKQQEKVIQDRTFGLKNKNKSKVVQSYIKGVANVVKNKGQSEQRLIDQEFQKRKEQQKIEQENALLSSLFKTVESVNKMAEPEPEVKKVKICPFFKQGLCQKGKKCKLSHDLTQEAPTEDIDLYVDQRMQLYGVKEEEGMDDWDEDKLRKVVEEQEKKYAKSKPTEIVCKYFLDAVEKGNYHWNWICPNGMACIYRHCLPPNFLFKKKGPAVKKVQESIEDLIDNERDKLKLPDGVQKVTLEVFLKWKEDKAKAKDDEIEKKRKAEAKKTGGKGYQALSGRALFKYDPTLFVDDENAANDDVYEKEEGEEEEEENEQEEEEAKEEEEEKL